MAQNVLSLPVGESWSKSIAPVRTVLYLKEQQSLILLLNCLGCVCTCSLGSREDAVAVTDGSAGLVCHIWWPLQRTRGRGEQQLVLQSSQISHAYQSVWSRKACGQEEPSVQTIG